MWETLMLSDSSSLFVWSRSFMFEALSTKRWLNSLIYVRMSFINFLVFSMFCIALLTPDLSILSLCRIKPFLDVCRAVFWTVALLLVSFLDSGLFFSFRDIDMSPFSPSMLLKRRLTSSVWDTTLPQCTVWLSSFSSTILLDLVDLFIELLD